jgi:hypothetical protein
MSKTIVKKYIGVNFPEGKKLHRDQIMDDGFLGIFDFKSTFVIKDYTESSSDPIHNLLEGGLEANTQYGGMGVTLEGGLEQTATSESIKLPAAFSLPAGTAGNQHYLYTHWFKHDETHNYGGSTFPTLGGNAYQTTTENQYNIWLTTGANGLPSSIRFSGNGNRVESADVSSLTDGAVHQFAIEFEATSTTTATIKAYIDGVQIGQQTISYNGTLNIPVSSGAGGGPQLGQNTGFTNTLRGVHYRAWIKDFEQSSEDTRTGAEIIAQEWALYNGRFA